MDDKILDLLKKVYIELQDTKSSFNKKMDSFGMKMDNLEKEVKQNGSHIVRLENQFHDKIGILNDEIKIVRGDITLIKDKLDTIEEKIEKHDMKIRVIEGGKKKKSI